MPGLLRLADADVGVAYDGRKTDVVVMVRPPRFRRSLGVLRVEQPQVDSPV